MTEAEEEAIRLVRQAGMLLVSQIADATSRGVLGEMIPGIRVFEKLRRRGVLYLTEEEGLSMEDGTVFEFTPAYCLVEEEKGRKESHG
jgi:hypothetical protein